MPNPQRRFDSHFADEKFELGGAIKGMPALRGSLDARDDYIKRFATDASYVDPSRSAQRLVGTFVYVAYYTKIDSADVSDFQDAADFEDAGHSTMKKAYDDEGLGDYFEAAFPYELLIWYDPRNVGSLNTTPAFPTTATVVTHAAWPTDDGGTTLASDVASLLGLTTMAAWYALPSTRFTNMLNMDIAYPHKRFSNFAQYDNPDINTDGPNTFYDMAYGRLDTPYTANVDFILSEPEGVALKAHFDGLNPTSLDLKDSFAAFGVKNLMSRHANLPIFYLTPFDSITTNKNTPF